jgi:fused signal recognition particle receptor
MFNFLKRDSERVQGALQKSRSGLIGRLTGLFHRTSIEDSFWDELEETLISADVGVETTLHLVGQLKSHAGRVRMEEPSKLLGVLKDEMVTLLQPQATNHVPLLDGRELPKPFVIMVVGVNGAGKTTSIAKLSHYLKAAGKGVLLGCADTFRAAASEQLQVWGKRVGIEVVVHRQGADPGAVAFDAYQSAKTRGIDFLIIDTAGRLHTNYNLMEELKKVKRVLGRQDAGAPHLVLLVLDATTGHNGLAQAKAFTTAVECDGVFLAKLDGTARGGIVLAVGRELKLPVMFIGTGEGMEDMALFEPREFVEALIAPES